MKDRLLYLTIGVLIGIVVMQWTMPVGKATIVTPPVGPIVALTKEQVITTNGETWAIGYNPPTWTKTGNLPIPASDIQFVSHRTDKLGITFVGKSGNYWTKATGTWQSVDPAPVDPVPIDQSTLGKVKGEFN